MEGHVPYFIGIALPAELTDKVSKLKWQLHKEIIHSLKPLAPHITLLHPPSLQGVAPDTLLPLVRGATSPRLPVTILLESVGSFGCSVLYIEVHSPELEALQARLVELLPPEARRIYAKRSFIPHVTIAQTRPPYQLDIEVLKTEVEDRIPLPVRFDIDSVSVFTSSGPREYQASDI